MALSDTAYYAYRRELQNRPPAEGNRREPEGGRTFLLAMGEDGEDGVVVDLTGGRYEGLPAFVPDARKQLDAHIASIAEYCVLSLIHIFAMKQTAYPTASTEDDVEEDIAEDYTPKMTL